MKNLYIIFSSTDLKTGKVIRFVTRNQYNHCSVCLREDLSRFYSFSRVYYSNPLIGGFVVESPCRYTLSSRTRLKIVTLPVSDEKFEEVRSLIHYMHEHGDEFVYNYFSVAAYPFGKRFVRNNAFTCAEFTNHVVKTAGFKMPKRSNILEMERALADYTTWEGRAVDILPSPAWGEDKYLEHIGKRKSAVQMATRFKRLVLGHT